MAILTSAGEAGHTAGRLTAGRIAWRLALAAVLLAAPGCRGCIWSAKPKTPEEIAKEEAEKREAQRKKEKKPDFEVLSKLLVQPHEPKAENYFFKPGHWASATLEMKTNNFDFLGELETSAVDGRSQSVGLPGTPYTFSASRPAALPKKQPKTLRPVVFVPPSAKVAGIAWRLRNGKGGYTVFAPDVTKEALGRLQPYQYHFVVVARWPERYGYLRTLDSLGSPSNPGDKLRTDACYPLVLLKGDQRVGLPAYGLCWTSIAYVLWDGAQPDTLGTEQQLAMLDWLHWGGQLVISGPDSLDRLRGSFLQGYLPADSTGSRPLGAADLQAMGERWTPPVRGQKPPIVPARPWDGVSLVLRPEARFVPGAGDLVAERRVGRGRIVVSAFRLSGAELTGWAGYDGFFNACLMGRPPREFYVAEGQSTYHWVDGASNPLTPDRLCQLRYFTRDTGARFVALPAPQQPRFPFADPTPDLEQAAAAGPEVGAWSDFNSVANLARNTLKEAARVEIPDQTFVVWVVCGYLLVLVPGNWLLFRLLGKVEWAWVAAPLIALACTVLVIRWAELDIGFARSVTELAVVEMQGDYQRAHVTRYTALYTSWSTRYAFESDDPGLEILPFPSVEDPATFHFLPGQGVTHLRYDYGERVSLSGFQVWSNTTDCVHSEQMLDLGGGFVLEQKPGEPIHVLNQSNLPLQGAGVLRRNEQQHLEAAWIGSLDPGKSAELDFVDWNARDRESEWSRHLEESPVTSRLAPPGALNVRPLWDLAADAASLRPGDVRLVGWVDRRLSGLEIRPAAPQTRSVALVVARLHYAFGDDPRPDKNTRAEFDKESPRTVGPPEDLPQPGSAF